MSTNLFSASLAQANSAPTISEAASAADIEGAKLGAAAERKRQQEAADSLDAALASHGASGKGVKWERRIRANGEVRHVSMWERDGAYSERGFLNLCNRAARAAGKGRLRWDGEAVDSIAAELCVSILAETAGRMPRKGTLGRRAGFEDADAAYLTSCAARLIADALKGERRAAGLSAEIAPMAAAEGAKVAQGADLLADSVTDAEGTADRYMAEPPNLGPASSRHWGAGDWQLAELLADRAAKVLTPDARQAIKRLAVETGERPAAVIAAIVSALRMGAIAAELAESGLGASESAVRKAASLGRAILRRSSVGRVSAPHHFCKGAAPSVDPSHWGAADWRMAEAVAILSDWETADREGAHISELGPPAYRGASLEWADRRGRTDGAANPVPATTSKLPAAERERGALKV